MSSFRGAILASLLLLANCLPGAGAHAQARSADSTLTGTIVDPSDAIIPGATIHLHSSSLDRDTLSDKTGSFTVKLPPGVYDLEADSPGFAPFIRDHIALASGQHRALSIKLVIAARADEVNVPSDSSDPTDPSQNKSALVFKGASLAALSDDDATLQQQLTAIAGGDEGSPQIFIDGFSGGRFPPKSSIQEIRINQNPYSAQYDQRGYGRIEVFTKPGGGQMHGFLQFNGNDNDFNARNPYDKTPPPPYHTLNFDGNVSGPLGKKTSFFVSDDGQDMQNNAIVNATILDSTFTPVTLSQAVPNPTTANALSFRLDRQFSAKNTLTTRYEFSNTSVSNSGIGLFTLPTEGSNSSTQMQTLQLSDTELVSPKIVSETRFQYIRTRTHQAPIDSSPTIIVQGAFNGGGSPSLISRDNQDRYEFQEYLSIAHGSHFIRAGVRYRLLRDANLSTANYNGEFTFPSITAYQITQQGLAQNLTDAEIRATCVDTTSGPVCGGATQFNLTTGQPSAAILTGDVGVYFEDEWKVRKNLTITPGFRFESQSAIPDHFDPAPHFGFAWDVHPKDKASAWLTLRGGFAIFYDRFPATSILQATRENGTTQQSYFVQNPCFYPSIPPVTSPGCSFNPTATEPSIDRISPHLRSEYSIEGGLTAEHRFGKKGSISSTYMQSHGVHQFLSENVNAPVPGTYNPSDPTSGVRPFGGTQNIYQFSSDGLSNGRTLFANGNIILKYFQLFSFYVLQFRDSDAGGVSSFPSNPYDIRTDYGPANGSARQRFYTGFWSNLPHGFAVGSFLATHSGEPFNITTGTDLNGDTIYNDRPAFATDLTRPSVVHTPIGNFDTNPLPSQKIVPYNYGTSASFASLQLHIGKAFKFGPRPETSGPSPAPTGKAAPKPDPRYSFGFSAEVQNIFNRNNPGPPVGVLTSPAFDQPISLGTVFSGSGTAANRVVTVRAFFSF